MKGGCFVLMLLVLLFDGVFGDEVSVMEEGDSVSLNSDVTKKQHEIMRWYFNDTLIAHINGGKSCLYDGEGGIFRNRLKVNYETGSLTITNITSEHTGYYEAEFIRSNSAGKSKCDRTRIIPKPISADIIKSFRLIVSGVFGDEVSVKEGDSVTLNSDVTKKQHHEPMRWYYNDILIAHINGDPNTSCLYNGEGGIFRDRLEVNYETGSLTITNIRSEHTGHYELEYIRRDGTGTSTSFNRNSSKCDRTKITSKPISADDIIKSFRLIVSVPDSTPSAAVVDSGLSAGVVTGIVVVVLLVFVAVGVILYRRWTANKGEKKISQGTDGENNSQGTDGENNSQGTDEENNSQDSLMKPEV